MKYIPTVILQTLIVLTGFSQKPDYNSIAAITDVEYNQLIDRFNQVDTSLKPEDLRVIYYGFVFQKNYDPEKFIPIENRVRDFNSQGDFGAALKLADSVLANYSVSIVCLFEKAFACAGMGLVEQELQTGKKYNALLRTIVKSGDGRSPETAIHIISPNDEFDVIRYFGLTATSYVEYPFDGATYDVLTLKKNKLKLDKMYFDITPFQKLKEKKAVDILRDK